MQKTAVVTQSTHTEFLSLTEIKLPSCKILPYGALRMNIIYKDGIPLGPWVGQAQK